jgi:hypothetical protein
MLIQGIELDGSFENLDKFKCSLDEDKGHWWALVQTVLNLRFL